MCVFGNHTDTGGPHLLPLTTPFTTCLGVTTSANSYYYDQHGDTTYLRPTSAREAWHASRTFSFDDYEFRVPDADDVHEKLPSRTRTRRETVTEMAPR